MQPVMKMIENTESANAFRFADPTAMGSMVTVETSYGITKRQLLVCQLVASSGMGLTATQLAVDMAYLVADLILAGPTDEKSMVDLDKLSQPDPRD